MAQSLHHLNCLLVLNLWSATLESLDVPVLPINRQSRLMASLRIIVRALGEEIEEYTLDFPQLRRGLVLYVPSTRQIVISGDVICDETFASTVAETWRPFHDALAL